MKKYRKWIAGLMAGLMLTAAPLTAFGEEAANVQNETQITAESGDDLTGGSEGTADEKDDSIGGMVGEDGEASGMAAASGDGASAENELSESDEQASDEESENEEDVDSEASGQEDMATQTVEEDLLGAPNLNDSMIYSGQRTYTRLNGANRYLTATNIASKIMEIRGISKLDGVVLCSGLKFPDALSGSYLAYSKGLPVIYQNPDALRSEPTQYILEHVREGGTVYIMGLEIPSSLEETFTAKGLHVERIGGANRYDTNIKALKESGVPNNCLFVASGENFPDAMCAAACGMPIMLVKYSLTEAQKAYLGGLKTKPVIYVAGGNAVVSDALYAELGKYASGIKRLYGSNRYGTSKAIADEIFQSVDHNQVVITEGNNYVDGLAASQLAAALGVPMILASDRNKSIAMDYVSNHGILRGFVSASESLLSNKSAEDIMGIFKTLSGSYKDGTYRLRSAADTSYALTVPGNKNENGVGIRLERCYAESGQTMTLSTVDGGIMMTPLCADKAVDVNGGNMAENNTLLLFQYKNGKNQKWQAVANSDGTYSFKSLMNPAYYMTVLSTKQGSSGVGIHTEYTDSRVAYQKFYLEIVDAKRNMPNGVFTIACDKDRTKVVEVAGKSKADCANIQINDSGKGNAQKFRLNYLGDGYYQIINVRSGKALDIVNGSSASGANVMQCTVSGSSAQKWRFEINGSGLRICSAMGTSLDVYGGKFVSGANIDAYRTNTTDAQRFCLIPTTPSVEKGYTVAIDAGHQRVQNKEKEPNGPGSSVMKQKVTSGTSGSYSGLDEYVLNLQVALKLQAELEKRGYNVYMIRTTHDVNISNAERAKMATAAGADIFIRIHANSSDNSSVRGVLMYQPSMSNPYLSSAVKSGSQRLSSILLSSYVVATGMPNKGILTGDEMTGINWATMPVSIVEMGFMSNRSDDLYMASASGQAAIVQGLANGVDQYFG